MKEAASTESSSFFVALVGDGRPLLSLTGLALVLSGGFALFLSATGSFLPHDVDYLGMAPVQLCSIHECRIVHFMFHDRVSFGGVLIAIGTLYLWLAEFPLKRGEEWSWWAFAVSGATGFASFLCYLGYGYLDTWHGVATLALLPCYLLGMVRSRALLATPHLHWRSLLSPAPGLDGKSRTGFGRICLLLTGMGQVGAGSVIMVLGMTTVFVPSDLRFLGLRIAELMAINPRLVPLIAHDRAGFGGGLVSCGLLVLLIVWKSAMTRPLWQALLISGSTGFACAFGVHFMVGYLDVLHLLPAALGTLLFLCGIAAAAPGSAAWKSLPVPNPGAVEGDRS